MLLETIPKVVFQLGQELDSSAAVDMLNAVPYVNYLATATGKTLDFVSTHMLDPVNGHRIGADTIVVALLAAQSQEGFAAVNASGENLRSQGAHVVVITTAVTDGNVALEEEALSIAQSPSDVFSLDTLEAAIQQGNSLFETEFMMDYFCLENISSTVIPTATTVYSSSKIYSSTTAAVIGITPSLPLSSPLATLQSPFPTTSTFLPPTTSFLLQVTPTTSFLPQVTPTPLPSLTYCSQFLPTDVIVIISASGQTGADVFYQFTNLAATLATNLIDGNGIVR